MKKVWERTPTPKKVWERCSHGLPRPCLLYIILALKRSLKNVVRECRWRWHAKRNSCNKNFRAHPASSFKDS